MQRASSPLANAALHLPPEAGARHERRLEAVRCSAVFGAARTGTEPISPSHAPRRLGRTQDEFASAPSFLQPGAVACGGLLNGIPCATAHCGGRSRNRSWAEER